jgi:TATA-box binding protein (TBP) (component of TFIID and TFIIIB)
MSQHLTVHNIVHKGQFQSGIDFHRTTRACRDNRALSIERHRAFPGMMMRLSTMDRAVLMLFESGTFVVTGVPDLDSTHNFLLACVPHIVGRDGSGVSIAQMRIMTTVATLALGSRVNLAGLASHEQDVFTVAPMQRMRALKVTAVVPELSGAQPRLMTAMIFERGSIIFTGRTEYELAAFSRMLAPLVNDFLLSEIDDDAMPDESDTEMAAALENLELEPPAEDSTHENMNSSE